MFKFLRLVALAIGLLSFETFSSNPVHAMTFDFHSNTLNAEWKLLIIGVAPGADSTFDILVGYSRGAYINGPDTISDPLSYSYFEIDIGVSGAGHYLASYNGCSEFDLHCSRADFELGGTFDAVPQQLTIDLSTILGGPYAFSAPTDIFITLPDYLIAVDAPEPATWAMLLLGFSALALLSRRRRRHLRRGEPYTNAQNQSLPWTQP